MNSQYRRDRSQITSHGRGESKKSLRYSDLKSEGGGEGGGGENSRAILMLEKNTIELSEKCI